MKKKVVLKTAKNNSQRFVAAPSNNEINSLSSLYHQRQYIEADESARKLIQRFPKHGFAWKVLGVVLQAQGKVSESLQAKQTAVDLLPDDIDACNNLGNAYQEQNRLEEAEKYLRQALKISPNFFVALNNLGLTLEKKARFEEAEICYQQALKLRPDYIVAHYNYGNILQKMQRFEDAINSYQAALALQPNYIEALNNCGGALQRLDYFQEAERCFRQVLTLQSNYPEALNNLGYALEKQERFDEAENYYRQALRLRPNDADTHDNLSVLLLLTGRLQEGWAERQWFYHPLSTRKPIAPDLPVKQWQGEPLQGKAILIHTEQGFGDMIHFVRYSQLLHQAGATVYITVAKPLIELFKTVPWIERVLRKDELPQVDYDFWVFPLMLPFRFRTTLENIPNFTPYLSVDAKKSAWWKIWLDKQIPINHKRIGLVWAGNPIQSNDRKRSLSLNQFSVFANLENITFISLQLGEKAQQELKNAPAGLAILDAGRFIEDFTDSAALLNNVDLLITVCSAPAHLAGALNLPVWTMISKPFEWRWLLNRSDSVWYKSMRLFRQSTNGDWTTVLNEVKTALIAL